MLARKLCQKIQRHAGRVRLRLVHVVLNIREGFETLFGRDELAVVFYAQLFRQLCGIIRLIKLIVIKPDAECVVRHQAGGDITGIYAARKKRANLHIGNAVRGHRFMHGFIQLVCACVKALLFGGKLAIPIALNFHLAVFIGEIVRGGQLIDAFEERLFRGGILQRQIGQQRIFIHGLLKQRVL